VVPHDDAAPALDDPALAPRLTDRHFYEGTGDKSLGRGRS
jgi:hypothetical protein